MRALRFGALLVLIAAAFGALVSVAGGSGRRAHVTTTATVGMTSLAPNASILAMIGQGYPVFQGAASSGYTLTSPNAGAITSWSFLSAGAAPGTTYELRVLHHVSGQSFTPTASSAVVQVTTATGIDAVNGPFAVNLAIAAGDSIALQPIGGTMVPLEQGVNGQDGIRFFPGPVADGATATVDPASAGNNGQIVPVQATVQSSDTPALSVSLGGSGAGSVAGSASPAIACPGACSQQYANGTSVTLTATAAAGSRFTSWSGGGCSGAASTCIVKLSADVAVIATFGPLGPVPQSLHGVAVVGTPQAGQAVRCAGDTWNTFGTALFTYAWFETELVRIGHGPVQRVTTQAASGPSRTFVLPDYSPGATISCTATATNANGSSAPVSSAAVAITALAPVLARSVPILGIFTEPTIGATVAIRLGRIYVCSPGTWTHHPSSYRYQWFALPSRGTALSAGTLVGQASTLSVTRSFEAQWIVCRVTAANAAGSTQAISNREYISAPDYGVHVNSIEITQGVQTVELPTRSATDPSAYHVSYRGVILPEQPVGSPPATVAFANGHATVVRVYVDTTSPLRNHSLPVLVLHAFRDGHELAPGPIAPDQVPPRSAVPSGVALGALVARTRRTSPTGAYTFTLPYDWTFGNVSFEAQANPDVHSTPPCDLSCEERTLFLDKIHFNKVTAAQIDPLAFYVTTRSGNVYPQGYPSVDPAWYETQAVTPFPLYVNPYRMVYDATTTVNPPTGYDYPTADAALLSLVKNWANDNDTLSSRFPFGIVSGAFKFSGGLSQRGHVLFSDLPPRSVASDDRPLTAMAHELNHGFGRVHAGTLCKSGTEGQIGELWPPTTGTSDGQLDGVGLDTSGRSPYAIIPPTSPETAMFDLMSYCGVNMDGTLTVGGFTLNPAGQHWISVQNWNRDVTFRAPGPILYSHISVARAYTTSPPASIGASRTLAVNAFWDLGSGRTTITSVRPDADGPTIAAAGDTFSLVGRDAAGNVVAQAGAVAEAGHADGGSPFVTIEGKLPVSGVHEIDLVQSGAVVARVTASAHAPTVALTSPASAARVGGAGGALLRWRAADGDGDHLQADVRYSADGGRTWSTVYVGPDHGGVTLPSGLLGASRHAEVRVYLSDGFNEAIVTSPPFVAVGAPPVVSISSPRSGARTAVGGSLDLSGNASDDSGARLTGGALTWRDARRVIGRGANAAAVALAAGRHTLTLTAHDRHGRTTTVAVRVTISPSPPVVRILRIPGHLSARDRRLTLRISALAPATLTIANAHGAWLVTAAPRTVIVPVSPGATPLRLRLMLRSGHFVTEVPVRVARSSS